jgi:hypothetical protein
VALEQHNSGGFPPVLIAAVKINGAANNLSDLGFEPGWNAW